MIYLLIFLSLSTLTFLLLYAREKGESKTLRDNLRKEKFYGEYLEAKIKDIEKVNSDLNEAYEDLKKEKLKSKS